MKVSNKNAAQLASTIQKKESPFKKGTDAGASKAAASAVDPGVIKLSNRAQNIKKATDIVKSDSVDEKKIAHFQNLIDSGKYQMDSAKVADRLVDEHMKFPV